MEQAGMDRMAAALDATSLEDLVALALARGVHLEDETDRDSIIGLLQAVQAADHLPSPPARSLSPAVRAGSAPTPSITTTTTTDADNAGGGGGGGERAWQDRGTGGKGAAMATTATITAAVAMGSLSPPPRRDSPMPFGSPLQMSQPCAPRLSDILAAGGMRGARDDASSVGAEAGTDAGSAAGGPGGGGAFGDGGSDGDTEAEGEAEASSVGGGVGGGGGGAVAGNADERSEAVDTFVGITQVSPSRAEQFLHATDWNVGAAINLFMESGGEATPPPALPRASRRREPSPETHRSSAGGEDPTSLRWSMPAGVPGGSFRPPAAGGGQEGDDDEQSDEDAGMVNLATMATVPGLPGLVVPAIGGVAVGAAAGPRGSRLSTPSGSAGGGSPGEQDQRYPGGYSEDGVRAPIPNRRDRLIGGAGDHAVGRGAGTMLGGMLRGALVGRAGGGASADEKDNTDWIFSIPEGLSFPSDFVDTRQICKEQKKWLMVNIQDHEEFLSHRLNKDVWSNETILTLLRGNFIFWQRNKTLGQARYYMDKYNLAGEVLPHTAILDPRTGAQLLRVVGYVEPEDLSMALVEFLENNSIDQVKAPKVKTIGMGNIAHSAQRGYHDTPGKEGTGSEKASPDNSVGTYGRGGGIGPDALLRDSAYESFGSEDYVYEDDGDDDAGQGTSIDGEDTVSRASTSNTSTTATVNAYPSPPNSNSSPIAARSSPPRAPGIGGGATSDAIAAVTAAGAAELVGPWRKGSPEDELRLAMEASLKDVEEGVGAGAEEVPKEPDSGAGVTQVRFRLPSGTIARRFWMSDRVSVLYQYVRTTVEEASSRPFDLLSGHPPASLSDSKASTLEGANLSNTAIMVRWL